MPDVSLIPLTPENYDACLALRVHPAQGSWVAPNVKSVADARVYPYLNPLVVMAGGEAVGFGLWGRDPDTGRYYIVRMMIDAAHQGKGLGKAATAALIELIRARPGCDAIYLSFVPGNETAERMYAALGFKRTGEVDPDGEIVMKLDLSRAK
jgi:diamine N-acetyltransferase